LRYDRDTRALAPIEAHSSVPESDPLGGLLPSGEMRVRLVEMAENALSTDHSVRDTLTSEIEEGARHFLVVAVPCADQGEPDPTESRGHAAVVVIDTSTAIEHEIALRDARRKERTTWESQKIESLGLLAGGIAHDFNNILVGVLGNAEVARQLLAPGDPAVEVVNQIAASAERAADLCRQMLAYAGRADQPRRPVDLREVVRDSRGLLGASLSKSVSFVDTLGRDVPPIYVAPILAQQVVINLVTNAAEACERTGGTVHVEVATTTLREGDDRDFEGGRTLPPGTYVELVVEDDGPGLDPQTIHRVFDPFFSTRGVGRGLGLASTLGIVHSLGGGVRAENRADVRGACFRALFPPSPLPVRAEREKARHGRAGPVRRRERTGTVLVVDDEPTVRKVCRRLLERHGYDVLEARDGAEGLEVIAARGDRIVCVVLDASMPGMTGLECLERIKERVPDLPVILSSGFEPETLIGAESVTGVSAFLRKPYRGATLLACVSRVSRRV
jgi:signal transduction histidine kinase